jgi:hypothetical protein
VFAWAGYIESYDLFNGINTQGRSAWFFLRPFEDQPDPEVRSIEVHFGNFEVAPGAAFGEARPEPDGKKKVVVELPLDQAPAFWRDIDKDCLLTFFGSEGNAITSYATIVKKLPEGDTDQGRRERADAMRRRLEEEADGAYELEERG